MAIKVFTEAVGLGGAERFVGEIGFLARLHHPHILPLLDSGSSEGLLYYVMPFVEGESLRERMGREPALTTQESLRLLLEVCDALRYAHAQGIVHRDIKPENIMLVDRHAVVADFGVARAVHRGDSGSNRTSAGLAVGTPTYMSPEQASADPNVDHRVDLYALGVVAYEVLAGTPPFTADSQHLVLAAHVTATPPDLAGSQRWPRWAPDGSTLAFQAGGTVYSVPALGGSPRARVEGPGGTGGIWRFSIAGDPAVALVRRDDPDRPVHRADIVADTERVYLLVSEFGSSVWPIPIGATP